MRLVVMGSGGLGGYFGGSWPGAVRMSGLWLAECICKRYRNGA